MVLVNGDCVFFFFQAEDGIRDKLVTGVQTCALPILGSLGYANDLPRAESMIAAGGLDPERLITKTIPLSDTPVELGRVGIGRGACRGRGEISGVAGSFKKKKKEKRQRRDKCENLCEL